jgi:ACS family glucarate transporter-like MFS transporter
LTTTLRRDAHTRLAEGQPTHARRRVVVFAASLAVVCYIDRVAIAQAAPFIATEFKLTPVEMGHVLAAFSWSYTLFEVPTGWLGDRLGSKLALTWLVVFWSAFTAATAGVWSFVSLLAARFCFGAGEAGCFPNIAKTFTVWLPPREQARAQGIIWMCARMGGALAPAFVVVMLRYFSWRQAFVALGIVGILWSVLFSSWYRDDPRAHPSVNQAEQALLPAAEVARHATSVPWSWLLTSKAVWLLSLQYFCLAYGWQFYITWLPTYLIQARQVPLQAAGLLSGLPLLMGAIACAITALLYPRLVTWFKSQEQTWCAMSFLAFSGAAVFLLLAMLIRNPYAAVGMMAVASFSNDLAMPGIWAAVMEIGGPFAGTTSAFMNTLSCIGGGVEATLTGYIIHWTNGNWYIAFASFVAVYAMGFLCWIPLRKLLTDPTRAGKFI